MGLSVVTLILKIVSVGYCFMATSFIYAVVFESYSKFISAYVLILFSLFWTIQVLSNTMRVTTAGLIGMWWFDSSQASSFCSPSIKDSLVRSTTYR